MARILHPLIASLFLAAWAVAQPSLVKAWIKDSDGDGAADKVFVQFTQSLDALPASIQAQWNAGSEAFREASGARLSFADAERTVVRADFDPAFPSGWTGRVPGQNPVVKVPSGSAGGWETRPLEDSIPPLLLEARLYPGRQVPDHDTLRVRVSEALKAEADLLLFLRFSESCSDTGRGESLLSIVAPITTGRPEEYLVIYDRDISAPKSGGCLSLNGSGSGSVTDLANTLASERRVPVQGPGTRLLQRPMSSGRIRIHAPLHTADGRRLTSNPAGSAPRGRNLITFKEVISQEGTSDDHTPGHSQP